MGMALAPVIPLLVNYFVFRERIDLQAIPGTLLVIAGGAVLFLV
jgi:drug/metabolite transporter (DMT)-like permease